MGLPLHWSGFKVAKKIIHDLLQKFKIFLSSSWRLQSSQNEVRDYVELSPFAIAMLDQSLCYLVASEKWKSDFHLKASEVSGKSFSKLSPKIAERLEEICRRSLTGTVETNDGEVLRLCDGKDLWIRWKVTPWHGPNGQVGGVFIFCDDISIIKDCENRLNKIHEDETKAEPKFLADLSCVIDSLPFSVAVINQSSEIIAANLFWHSFAEGSAGGMVGENYLNSINLIGGDREIACAACDGIQSVLNDERETFSLEYPCHSPDKHMWFILYVAKLKGQRMGAVISHIDVTTQKLAQLNLGALNRELEKTVQSRLLKLAESELRYRTLFEAAYDAIFVVNEEGLIVDLNSQAAKMFGYQRDEIVGKNYLILVPENAREEHEKRHSHYITNPTARPMGLGLNLTGLRKNFSEFAIDVSLSPVSLPEGKQINIFVRDVSAQKKFKDRETFLSEISKTLLDTRDYSQLLHLIAEAGIRQLTDICIISICEGSELKLKVVACEDEIKKAKLKSTCTDLYRNVNSNYSGIGVFQTKGPLLVEMRELARDSAANGNLNQLLNELEVASFLILPLISRGLVIGTITFAMTTSGRSFLEDDIEFLGSVANRCAVAVENAKYYQEAQEATKVRELVLSIVAHDLLNPIAVIDMSGQKLKSGVALSGEGRELIADAILRSSANMQRMVADLLDFGKIQSGTLKIELKRVAVASVMASAMEPMLARALKKSQKLSLDIPEGTPDILCDHGRIVQVLWNIIGNAIKYTPANGAIVISTSSNAECVQFNIADSGPGLAKGLGPKIFNYFWQSEKTSESGAGLGLAISKGLVEAQGGKIWVETDQGHGCTFHFTVPIA
jgi:PAS domain S-box-containing protein